MRPLSFGKGTSNPNGVRAAAEIALVSLDWLERTLEDQPLMTGWAVSAVDIAAMPILQMFIRFWARAEAVDLALSLDDVGRTHPSIALRLERIKAVRGYDAAYPPHWRTYTLGADF